jgi:hypothetical protein
MGRNRRLRNSAPDNWSDTPEPTSLVVTDHRRSELAAKDVGGWGGVPIPADRERLGRFINARFARASERECDSEAEQIPAVAHEAMRNR